MADTPITWNQTVRAIAEFLEVAIHTILYVRGVYPADLFVRRKKYDTPVWQARHPALTAYVAGAVRAVRAELVLGKVDKLVLVVKDGADAPLERFVFSLRTMLDIEPYQKDDPIDDAMPPATLGLHFRGLLTKLSFLDALLAPLPAGDDLTFALVLELDAGTVPSAPAAKHNPPPWSPAPGAHTTAGADPAARTHVVRAVDTGVINVGLVVQEGPAKLDRRGALPQSLESLGAKGKAKATPVDDDDEALYATPPQQNIFRPQHAGDDSLLYPGDGSVRGAGDSSPLDAGDRTMLLDESMLGARPPMPSQPWTQPERSQQAPAFGAHTIYDD